MVYAFQQGDSLFVVLDAFYVHPYSSSDCGSDTYLWKKGYYSDNQLTWFQNTLEKNVKTSSNPEGWAENVFVFSHQPAFDAHQGEKKLYDLYDHNGSYAGDCGRPKYASYNTNWVLWALMEQYEVEAFFPGHSHFYHRWDVLGPSFEFAQPTWSDDSTLASDFKEEFSGYPGDDGWKYKILQVLVGSSGAKLETCDYNTDCELPGCACLEA